jgi:hypothetical protein
MAVPTTHGELGTAATAEAAADDVVRGTVELRTEGVRNVLFTLDPPAKHFLDWDLPAYKSAVKYDAIVIDAQERDVWKARLPDPRRLFIGFDYEGPTPYGYRIDHVQVRAAVLGESGPSQGVFR